MSEIKNINSNLQNHIFERESYQNTIYKFQSNLFRERLRIAKNLYKNDLTAHFGCVNAIEFSNGGEFLISGGDDKRVLLWNVEKAIAGCGEPRAMEKEHQSNIFCLSFNMDNTKIFSGGNDDLVIVHDNETGKVVDVYIHTKPVYGLSVDPTCDSIISTAGEDGRILLFDQRKGTAVLSIGKYRAPFHAVQFHPYDGNFLVSANSKKGAAFWDIRKSQSPIIQYGGEGNQQSCMSVRFNSNGNQILALRRRLPPVLYNTFSHKPVCQFYHPDYYNSCTMKSCCFAGEDDEFVLSGSDDFNLYVWRVGDINLELTEQWIEQTQMVLYGHRSIVNQVRYNPQKCLFASSGVEKIVKLWSPFQQKGWAGTLVEEATGPENPREVFSHDAYFSLVHMNWSNMTHDYSNQNTNEDPRMMAFFDSLIQQEIEGWNTNNSSDSDQCSVGTSENSTRQSSTESSDDDVVNYVVHTRDRNRRGSNLNQNVKPQRNKYANRIAYLIATKRNTLRRLALKGASQTSRQRQNAALKVPKRKNHHHHHASNHTSNRNNLRTSRSGSSSAKRVGRFNSLSNRARIREDNDHHHHHHHHQKNSRFTKNQHHTSMFRSFRRKNKNYRVHDRPESSSEDDNSSHSETEGVETGNVGAGSLGTIGIAIPSTSTGITSNGKDIAFRLRQQQDDDSDADESPINSDHGGNQNAIIQINVTSTSSLSKLPTNGLHKLSNTTTTTRTTTIDDVNHSNVQSSDIDEDRCSSPINRRKRPLPPTTSTGCGDLDIYSSHSNSRLSNSSYLEDEHDSSSNESLDCFSKKRKIVPSNNSNNNNNNNNGGNNNTEFSPIHNNNSIITTQQQQQQVTETPSTSLNNDENLNNISTNTIPTELKTPNGNNKMNNNLTYTPDSGISLATPGCSSSISSSSKSNCCGINNGNNCCNNINNNNSNNILNSHNNNYQNNCSKTNNDTNSCNSDKFSIKLFHQKIARVRKSYRKKFGDDSDSD